MDRFNYRIGLDELDWYILVRMGYGIYFLNIK